MAATPLPYLASRLFNTPLAVHPGKARAILEAIGGRVVDAPLTVDGPASVQHVAFEAASRMGRLGDPLGRRFAGDKQEAFDRIDEIAIIPIEGTLIHKGKWVGTSSGETSYEGIQTRVRQAAADPSVRGVVFEIDSFGGEVAGAFDTAALIRKLSAEKPTIAILTDFALSAGYLLASAAREIVMPETGRAGSIGVITLHADYSAALAKSGVKVTVLSAGQFKGDGNPYEPLPAAVASRIRADLEQARVHFANAVAEGRGDRLSAAGALGTEADDFSGAAAAQFGLVDAIGHSSEAFDEFRASVRSGTSRRPQIADTAPRAQAAVPAVTAPRDEYAHGAELAQQLMRKAGVSPAPALSPEELNPAWAAEAAGGVAREALAVERLAVPTEVRSGSDPVRPIDAPGNAAFAAAMDAGAAAVRRLLGSGAQERSAPKVQAPPEPGFRSHATDLAPGDAQARELLGTPSSSDLTVEEVRRALTLHASAVPAAEQADYVRGGLLAAALLRMSGERAAPHARLSAVEAARALKISS
jgi:signal peptide peptidase SppA